MIDRRSLKLPFRKSVSPQWICPTCYKGVLKIQTDSFKFEETRASKRAHHDEDWTPDWIRYVFSCMLVCSNGNCKEVVSCSGKGFVGVDFNYYDEHGEVQLDWEDCFQPKYFFPHLKIFQYPANTPKDVAVELEASFALFFCNPSSAANHVRIVLEHLLTSLKVKRFKTASGQRLFMNLHQRIELLPKKHEHLKDLLFAVKWLGNAGSHSTQSISMDDVMDAYEIMEEVLRDLYTSKKAGVRKIAKEIIKKKGPRKRKS